MNLDLELSNHEIVPYIRTVLSRVWPAMERFVEIYGYDFISPDSEAL